MKICSNCFQEKERKNFPVNNATPDKLHYWCRECAAIKAASYRRSKGIKSRKPSKSRAYRVHKKDRCERCGFIPEHIGQLDVDHINGEHSDHSIGNLQTLCANCHRLKTFKCRNFKAGINRRVPEYQLNFMKRFTTVM